LGGREPQCRGADGHGPTPLDRSPGRGGGEVHRIRVNVEERTDGKFYYDHTLPDRWYFQEGVQAESPSKPGGFQADGTPEASAGRSLPGSSRPSAENIGSGADGINLLLQRELRQVRGSIKLGSSQAVKPLRSD
jgi:hypothetical protein